MKCSKCGKKLTQKEEQEHIWGLPKCSKCFVKSLKGGY